MCAGQEILQCDQHSNQERGTKTICGEAREETKDIKARNVFEDNSRRRATAEGITGTGLDLVQPK